MRRRWLLILVAGKNLSTLSDSDLRMVVLRATLALVGLSVGIGYIFIDHATGIQGNEPFYAVTIACSLITLLFNRAGYHKLASILFVSILNFIVFIFSAGDTYRSGVYIFFVVTSLTSFALFGYKDRTLALFFPIVSLALFLYSFWGEHSFIPKRPFTEEYLQINFTSNFIAAGVTSIAIVYFLINVNFQSEKKVIDKNEQLAKANAELDRFVYSASHDLRAPLSSILGLVNLYELSGNEAERETIINLIRERVNKMDNFINEILDYSRNARLSLRQENISSRELIHEIIEGLRYSKNFEKIRIDPGADDHVLCTDPERLKIVLNNLIANSLKYFDPDKTQSYIKIDVQKNKDMWSITVEDNGIGIPTELQGRIFEMFYRAHDRSEGSGLGLYIVKEVIARMHGSITVNSELNRGSKFTVTFPHPKPDPVS